MSAKRGRPTKPAVPAQPGPVVEPPSKKRAAERADNERELETPSKKRRVTKLAPARTVLKNVDVFVWGSPDFFQAGPVHPQELRKPWPLYAREKTDEEVTKKLKAPHLCFDKVLGLESRGFHNALLGEKDGKTLCYTWGCNDDGVLGRVTSLTKEEADSLPTDGSRDMEDIRQCTPTPVELENIVQVSVGNHHMIALTSDGSVWGWGIYKDDDGFIGFDPNTKDKVFKPMMVHDLPKKIVSVASSANVSLALTETGRVWEWGCTGQRVQRRCARLRESSLNYNTKQLNPHQLVFPGPVEEIYAGGDHHFAIDNTRQVYAWGINGWGQLGIGKQESKCQEKPKKVKGLGHDVIQLACGATHSLALTSDGKVYSWGRASYGQLGHGKKEKKVKINKANYIPKNERNPASLLLFSKPKTETLETSTTPAPATTTTGFVLPTEPAAPTTGGFVFGDAAPATGGFVFGSSDPAPSAGFVFGITASDATSSIFKVEEKKTDDQPKFTFGSIEPVAPAATATTADTTKTESAAFIFNAAKEDEKEEEEDIEEDEEEQDFTSVPEVIQFFEKLRNDTGAKAVWIGAGCNHSLVITDDGKIYGFGFNEQSQLGLNIPEDGPQQPEVWTPTLVHFGKTYNAVRCSAGTDHTILLASKK